MQMQFQKATKKKSRLRLAIDGPSGSGKTFTALIAASALAGPTGKIAVIDTERGSASLYSDKFTFDVLELETFSPQLYIDAINAAEAAGYSVIVIDSLSHAWEGEGGALDMVDKAAKRSQTANTFTAWKDVTPLQRKLVDAMLTCRSHIIVTMRSKTDYVIEQVERNGRTVSVPRKIGLAPIQRSGMEYEFTVFADMTLEHDMMVTKTRYDGWADLVVNRPGPKVFEALIEWLNNGEDAPPPPKQKPALEGKKEEEKKENPSPEPTKSAPITPSNTAPELRLKPDDLKEALLTRSKTMTGPVGNKSGLVASMLEQTLSHTGDPKASRHQLLKFLTGSSSLKDLSDGYILALYAWLKPAQDSGGMWVPDQMAAREAVAAFNAAQPEQEGLF